MKKMASIICALILALLIPAAMWAAGGLPTDHRAYVSEKYAGWNGVLQAWVCCEWNPDGNWISWLNGCAAEFERAHDGVYLEFIRLNRRELRAMLDGGFRTPDLIFFSPNALQDARGLEAMDRPEGLRAELADCGGGYAVPVAAGGYIWVCNAALADEAPLTLPVDDAAHSYSAAAIALMSDEGEAPEAELDALDLDLGLPVLAAAEEDVVFSEDALRDFINGEIPRTIVDAAGLARLHRLRESGRGVDWHCMAAGRFAYTDQLLLAAMPKQNAADAQDRKPLAEAFIAQLLQEDAQAALADCGAYSVCRNRIHSDFSPYADLDMLLNNRKLIVPQCFSEYSPRDAADIVRKVYAGKCTAEAALMQWGLDAALPN